MATFKVGQRVKVIGHVLEPGNMDLRGHEGVITGFEASREHGPINLTVVVRLDIDHPWMGNGFCFAPEELAPITDPLADAFIERIKKLEPLREPATV